MLKIIVSLNFWIKLDIVVDGYHQYICMSYLLMHVSQTGLKFPWGRDYLYFVFGTQWNITNICGMTEFQLSFVTLLIDLYEAEI